MDFLKRIFHHMAGMRLPDEASFRGIVITKGKISFPHSGLSFIIS